MVSRDLWESLNSSPSPFLSYDFFHALYESGCVGPDSGWEQMLFLSKDQDGLLYAFKKDHSYGEFIFDWSWAQAFERFGLAYYPKITSMVPFTPVTVSHFLMREYREEKALECLRLFEDEHAKSECSSAHFLFIDPQEIDLFRRQGYLIRESIQYHFTNQGFSSFDGLLETIKTKKAKNIRNERAIKGLRIKKITGDELSQEHARRMYDYYISTIKMKNSFDYLDLHFFELIFKSMKDNILFVEAYENECPTAGALFFYDSHRLYGRYWGTKRYIENLHFELCYYQGIDFCLERKIQIFEAGAQGEHKISRGFRPVKIYSAHKLKNKVFHKAISDFIEQEKYHVDELIEDLSRGLPFK